MHTALRFVVAMSGGVDSSVVAGLLANEGYDLSAVFMRNWDTRDESGTDSGCEWKKDWQDVQKVCSLLDIPYQMVDLSREYWTRVFDPSLRAWEAGATPNPDIWCNKEVKFGALLQKIIPQDTWLATGHYARKSWTATSTGTRPQLLRPSDRTKDQTYYLSSIPEQSLARSIFPLAQLQKSEVREHASKWGLPTAERAESMGICFVGEKRRFDDFISQYITPRPGAIIDHITGEALGTYEAMWTFTIGQGAKIRGMPQKMFVSGKDPKKNEIYVVPGSDHPLLYKSRIYAQDWKWIWGDSPPVAIDGVDGFRARVQFRHRMMDVGCIVKRGDKEGSIIIELDEPQKAVAPGQVAAIWDQNWCLGCGVIEGAE
ncbi:hypothetical protein NLI96_g5414 [Meripilus lineatus]|uniref:tRNA-5-taurinomethyluridine 2-sulfurtransferase n=1 Tax=Meripilus lineatus TaxID=2056292 RepID=A0AAD5V314_9APHY|nr:hypothetical protein NLI96_g5414 [Physisporinus lineatus]